MADLQKDSPIAHAARPNGGTFPTTHWSVVLHAGAGSESQIHAALESLCRQYWYPLYAFVRRQGRSHHEAEDCTQEFLARLLASDGVARARPERGRFRSFLLTAVRNFLSKEWRRTQAVKRGGGQAALSLDFDDGDRRFGHEPTDPGLTAEQMFDRNWAVGLIDGAVRELRADYDKSGRGPLFATLIPLVWINDDPEGIAQSAERLGMTVHALTMALHRLRRRLGERLRAEVAETVADRADVDVELRHLIASVSHARA